MSTPATGDVVLYTPTVEEKADFTGTEFPALVVQTHGDGDATLVIFGCGDGGGPLSTSACFKRCDEGAGEGTWAPKP